MRGLKIVVVFCLALLLLQGCDKLKKAQDTIDDPSSPQILSVRVQAEEETGVPTLTPLPSDARNQPDQTMQPAQTQEPKASDSAAPAGNRGEVQANDELVDALIQELDDMGSLLDSLDDVQDADLIVPAS